MYTKYTHQKGLTRATTKVYSTMKPFMLGRVIVVNVLSVEFYYDYYILCFLIKQLKNVVALISFWWVPTVDT